MPTVFDLMVAPNGARLSRADHPALPITPEDLVATAVACEAAGATSIHAHIRDAAGVHSLDADRYNDVVARIRAATRLHVQISTEAAGLFDVAAQRECLRRVNAPDASIALREMARDEARLPETYGMVAARGLDMQHIVYDPDDLTDLMRRMEAGQIAPGSRRVICVLGRYAKDQLSVPEDLKPFLAAMPSEPPTWSVCAFGPQEQACLLAALDEGGHVRIGFENNRIAPDGTVFPDNAASVAAFAEAAEKRGFQPGRAQS